MATYSAKLSDIKRDWWIVDASDLVLGRLSSQVAKILRGKHKAMLSPNLDCGDNVVIVNADKIKLTGNKKRDDKTYYWHTGYPGGIKQRTAGEVLDGNHPDRVVKKAIERMLPRSPLGRKQFKKLYVYAGAEHPHEAQKPKTLDIASLNPKNTNYQNEEDNQGS